MSILDWFTKKPAPAPAPLESSGLGHADATEPYSPSGKPRARGPVTPPGTAANRKHERLERRELLYAVVREAMIKAGVLSSSYKFKVLSLDSRGRQYLIMMDLARPNASNPARLAEIEAMIAQYAKARHDILVTSVYWRINEHVTAGLSRPTPVAAASAPLLPSIATAATATAFASEPASAAAPSAPAARPHFEPLHPDEVVAFKQALAGVHTPLVQPGEIVQSGRRNPTPLPDFHDTEIDEGPSPLSGTQYGDLN